MFLDSKRFQKTQIYLQPNVVYLSIYKPSPGHGSCLTNFELDGLSRFDVYWIQTNRQTSKVHRQILSLFAQFKHFQNPVVNFGPFKYFMVFFQGPNMFFLGPNMFFRVQTCFFRVQTCFFQGPNMFFNHPSSNKRQNG